MIKYPSWDSFGCKYPNSKEETFEALCRFLFKEKFHLGDSLLYFKNHPGNETDVVKVGDEVIGFQSKFFVNGINVDDILDSLRQARDKHPDQTKYIIYTNKEFGCSYAKKNTDSKNLKPQGQKRIEQEAQNLNLSLEWMFGDNILDAVSKNELAYHIFFDLDSDLLHLSEYLDKLNELYSKSIHDSFRIRDKAFTLDRTDFVRKIAESVREGKNCMLVGESGVGKSVITKKYFLDYKNNTIFLYLNAAQFESNDLSTLLGYDRRYDIESILSYFKSAPKKVIILDSVEKIVNIRNQIAFKQLVFEFSESGWRFVCTVKPSFVKAVCNIFDEANDIAFNTLNVPLLTDRELDNFLNEYKIKKPQQNHLYERLRNLFYFARYVETSVEGDTTLSQFEQIVWNAKVRGLNHESSANQEKREECMLEIANRQLQTGKFIVEKSELDLDVVCKLMQDDIVISDGYNGYYVAHDIYQDWASVKVIDRLWNRSGDVKRFCIELLDNIMYRNAFGQWFSQQLEIGLDEIDDFIQMLFNSELPNKYADVILVSILTSQEYVKRFFAQYSAYLTQENYKWLSKLVRVLVVSCQRIHSYASLNGTQSPLLVPSGAGWDATIDFVYEHYEFFYQGNGNKLLNLLSSYALKEDANVDSRRKAGLLSLRPHERFAKMRQNQQTSFFNNPDSYIQLVYCFSDSIIEELKAIYRKTLDNNWFSHLSPYYELTEYAVRKTNGGILTPICKYAPGELCELLEMYWVENNVGKTGRSREFGAFDSEKAWGLREYVGLAHYFPASAYQTSIYSLLVFNTEETLKFIIRLMNHCTKCYSKNGFYHDECDEIHTTKMDGTPKVVMGNSTVWNLYRGTSGMATPYLLQSIHMALEKFLLDLMEAKQETWVKKCLDMIIDESNTLSLYAIVASIVVAYPNSFFEEGLVLFSNLGFFRLDQLRKTSELAAAPLNFAYNGNPDMYEERKKSNLLPHRKVDLQDVMLRLQFQFDESKDENDKKNLAKIFSVIDSLKMQLNEDNEDYVTDSFILSRIDYRSMDRKEVVVGGVKGIQFTPKLSEMQQQLSKEALEQSVKPMKRSMLRMWAIGRERGEKKCYENTEYEKQPLLALSLAKEINEQLKNHLDEFYSLPGDEFLPSLACATLIRDFPKLLNSEDFQFCVDVILRSLEDKEFMLSSSMTSLITAFDTLGIILSISPQYKERVRKIFLLYSSLNATVLGVRCCDMVACVVDCRNFWEHYCDFMQEYIHELSLALKENTHLTDIEKGEIMLAAISVGKCPEDVNAIAMLAVGKMAQLWNVVPSSYNYNFSKRAQDSKILSRYILSAPDNITEWCTKEIGQYLSNCPNESSFLDSVIIETISKKAHTKFWNIWNVLYPYIIGKDGIKIYGEALDSYLLNPSFCQRWEKGWFKIDSGNLLFFSKIASCYGNNAIVIYNIVSAFVKNAREHWKKTLKIVGSIVMKFPSMKLKDKETFTIDAMEVYVRDILASHRLEVKRDAHLVSVMMSVLDFMKSHNSKYASNLLTNGL